MKIVGMLFDGLLPTQATKTQTITKSNGGNIAHNMAIKVGVESLCGGVKILVAFLSHPYFLSSKPIRSEPRGEDFEKTLPYLVWDLVYPSAPRGIDNPMLNPAGDSEQRLAGLACS
ncbi:hypothetical protein ACFX11_012548 [Malus domestica]